MIGIVRVCVIVLALILMLVAAARAESTSHSEPMSHSESMSHSEPQAKNPAEDSSRSTLGITAKRLTQAHVGQTAYVVDQGELLLGLQQASYGVFNWLSLETIPLHDLLGSWNVFGKLKVIEIKPVSLALRTGIFYLSSEQIPEAEEQTLYRYYLGGTVSAELTDRFRYHFNVNNTSLHGNLSSFKEKTLISENLLNIENDIEYHFNDRRAMLLGTGYNLSKDQFTLGGSHVWSWTSFHLKLGLTFKTAHFQGVTMLPYLDIGVRF